MMAWLNSPEMARHATRLGEVMRYNTMFPAKLSEIAILVTARHWTAHYEWYAHKRLALKGGMDPKIIDDIRDRRTPVFDDPKGKMIYELAKSLHEGHGVSKSLYDEAVKVLTERGVVEVIGLCGYYTHGVDDAEHVRVRAAGRRSVRPGMRRAAGNPEFPHRGVTSLPASPYIRRSQPENRHARKIHPSSQERGSGMCT